MYEEYFRFASSPFRLNPDPKFFFGSRSHNKAMAYLHYGLRQAEGFIVISGEIGAGKSILIGHLIDQLDRSNVVAAHLLTANLEPSALLSHVLSAFRIEPAGTGESAAIEAFEDFLFDQMNRGRRVLLIVDEAQNLPIRTIEELRMLSNMDYDGTPLFQVFLVGQPEFRGMLAKPNMEQFRQRIIASYHLEPLGVEETREYIRHRLTVVGWTGDNPAITEDAFSAIHKVTGGVPRKINKLCNRILLYCSIEKRNTIDIGVVKTVVTDLRQDSIESAEAPPFEKELHADEPAAPETAPEPDQRMKAVGERAPVERAGDEPKKETRAPVVIPFDAVRKIGAEKKPVEVEAPEEVMEAANEAEPAAKAKPADKKQAKPETTASESPAPRDKAATTAAPAPAGDQKSPAQKTGSAMTSETRGANTPAETEGMSVLDRLRSGRGGSAKEEAIVAADAPEPATLTDVAKAIAEASAASDSAPGAIADASAAPIEPTKEEPASEALSLKEDPKGWRQSVVRSINETRDELKAAHSDVSRLRRRLNDLGRQRREKRQRIAANLSRAESLLSEIRNAWR